MLELVDIKKDYPAGDGVVAALKGVSLKFRKSEFVSILGPSGCGKTTMLNIIGGLDQYTSGDLIINNRSTKNYKDRDWDSYRNHSIGFVFQSYNLIPHQSVLQNVEIALTLSGVSKSERRKRAIKALKDVGLESQIHKKPSQLSGGQMQRVAIARAIVNDPDIILADEPTGALDTETSIQVMEILKEISKDRLIIMVTHNPELAEKYSTRIIKVLDGLITDDSSPYDEEPDVQAEQKVEVKSKGKKAKAAKKPTMSMFTAFSLSLKNLFTKKGRTALTSFAGSIGIIGIALIFSVKQGMTTYIDVVQEETLSSYPITLEAQHIDIGTLLSTFIGAAQSATEHENDAVYQKSMVYDMINSLSEIEESKNDLKSFKSYIEKKLKDDTDESGLKEAINGIQYSYNLDMLIYTENVDGSIIRSDTTELMQQILADYMGMNASTQSTNMSSSPLGSMMGSSAGTYMLWQEMLPGKDGKLISEVFDKQYDVVYGSWPTEYNEIVLVVDENNELDDMTLYALGLISKDDIDKIMDAAVNKKPIEASNKSWSFEEICDMEFKTVLNSDCFTYDENTGLYTDLRSSESGLKYLYSNGTPLKVSGIVKPNESSVSTILTGSIGYTSKLTEYVVEKAKDSSAIEAQLKDKSTDIFTGLLFKSETDNMSDSYKADSFKEYISSLDEAGKAKAYTEIMSIPPKEQVDAYTSQALGNMSREDMESALITALSQQMTLSSAEIEKYLENMSDDELKQFVKQAIEEQYKAQYAQQVTAQLSAMSSTQLAMAMDMAMQGYSTEQMALYHDEVLTFSDSTYEDNLIELGYVDLDDPSAINLYASSFENKDVIEEAINNYNKNVDELQEIKYTDYIGIMMSSITKIINAITYVLVAFVAISLIVSSIMIGVITLISVQERTKEIGILRAIGASKKNVSSMFNAETVIIGFTSGLVGVLITYLLCIPINIILKALTGIVNLKAILPVEVAIILVILSMILTLISGIIPSRSAAKKDPVVALRTE